MNTKLLIFFIVSMVFLVGSYVYYQSKMLSNRNYQVINRVEETIEGIKQKGFILTAKEESIVQELAKNGSNVDQIISAITIRREIIANNKEKQRPEFCNLTKQEILNDAFSEGVIEPNELEKLSDTYDLLCLNEAEMNNEQN